MQPVSRSSWEGGAGVPSYVEMYIYVPDNLATKPPIVVSNHACQSGVDGQLNANNKIKEAADRNGFIMIFPHNQGQNCWDVGSDKSLAHDGKGDTHGIAQMVRYALEEYNGDSSRVYVLGGSSGGMMTQALLGVYPELFAAGAPRAGVPCGCWAESYSPSNQWSGPCANGTVSKTADQWGDFVRAINPDYTGYRPRVQIMQGDADQTISSNNMGESIKQWTNVLGLNSEPDSTATISSSGYTYNCRFWKDACGYVALEAWFAAGGGHSMGYEQEAILKFFGLDELEDGDKDPGREACEDTGITGILNAGNLVKANVTIALRDRSLVLSVSGTNKVFVKIVNISGRIVYNGNHAVSRSTGSLSIPMSSLPTGYYITSVVCHEGDRRISSDNFSFVLTN